MHFEDGRHVTGQGQIGDPTYPTTAQAHRQRSFEVCTLREIHVEDIINCTSEEIIKGGKNPGLKEGRRCSQEMNNPWNTEAVLKQKVFDVGRADASDALYQVLKAGTLCPQGLDYALFEDG